MATKMKKYIAEQPVVLKLILDQYENLTQPTVKNLSCFTKVLLLGSGSSLNATIAAVPFWEDILGVETLAAAPTRVSLALHPADSTLVVAVSQSGRSTSTLQLVDRLQKQGYQVITMTADENSIIAKRCQRHMLINCGEEAVGPKTKGVTATILSLYILALALGDARGSISDAKKVEVFRALSLSVQNVRENMLLSMEFCKKWLDELVAYPHFTFISDEVGFPISAESALKILETLYVPAFAYEFEEYLHGVQNTIAPNECIIGLLSGSKNTDRMLRLLSFAEDHGCHTVLTTTLKEVEDTPRTLKLIGTGNAYTQPFEMMFFSQWLSALGSEAKGIDCDKPQFPDYARLMETKA